MLPVNINREENFSFWKNLLLVIFFFTLTPTIIATSLFSLISLSKSPTYSQKMASSKTTLLSSKSGVQVFASLPMTFPAIDGNPVVGDARVEIIRQYLSFYNSPLEPYAQLIVSAADKYQIDFKLITAIAQQESNLCKIIPPGTYNCWGWGIHSRGTLGFSSFEEGIEIVSQGLKEEYLDKGYKTIEDIMSKYTPLSNGSWAFGVNKFMAEME